jgi:hypothetical protein
MIGKQLESVGVARPRDTIAALVRDGEPGGAERGGGTGGLGDPAFDVGGVMGSKVCTSRRSRD